MLVPNNPLQKNLILSKLKAEHHAQPDSSNYAVNREIGQAYTGGYKEVDSMDEIDPRFRDYKQEAKDREKRKAARLKREKKKKNLL